MQKTTAYQVYNASAGSGKTFTLVKEYLKIILLHPDIFHFQKILAITFTNKAAAEMKERVLHNLQCFARGTATPMLLPILNETYLDKQTIQKKSLQITQAILDNYSGFNITTIDSFTHRIIRSFAYDFGLTANFEIELDTEKLLKEAVDKVIDQIGVETNLTKVLIDFALQKSDDDKTWDIQDTLVSFGKVLLNETDKQAFQKIENLSFNNYRELQKNIYKRLQIITNKLQIIGKKGKEILSDNGMDDAFFNYSMLPNLFTALAAKKDIKKTFQEGKLLKRFEENTLLNKKGKEQIGQVFDNQEHLLFEYYLEADNLYKELQLFNLFQESIIPLAVLSYIYKALENIKEENNIRLLAEFNELIYKKIQNEPVPFIYERLGEKFQHYFIDEMQDTSGLQWKNLAKLIENALSQEGGSLLLVGDAKQAIYRWRGGQSEQFIKLSNPDKNTEFPVPKHVADLDTNYRSYSEIINFNNDFFQHISSHLQNTEYHKLYNKGNRQKTNSKIGGYVQLEFVTLEQENLEKEAVIPQCVVETIRDLQDDFQWKDICILVRDHKKAVRIANHLNDNNIPIVSSETLLLMNNSKVVFLISLLQSIYQPNNLEKRVALLDLLFDFDTISSTKHSFFSTLVHLEESAFYKSLNAYGYNFDPGTFHQKSLYDAIEYCIRSFHIIQKPNAYIQFFLDIIIDFQIKNGSNLGELLDYWELQKDKLSISIPDGKNAVKIMTIHKAKGLQFPVVIFPYDLDIYRQKNAKIWYPIDNPDTFNGFKTLYIPYKKELQFTDTTGAELYQERRETLELDNYNLLYVALTRAEEQLYIITDKKKEEKINNYSGLYIDFLKYKSLWNPQQQIYHFGDKKRVLEKFSKNNECSNTNTIAEDAKLFISTDISEHEVALYTKSGTLWDTEQGEAIAYGNLLHELLAHIKTEEDIDYTIERYKNQGFITAEIAINTKKILHKLVNHPDISLFYKQNIHIYNEREILTDSGAIIIPDRLVILPNKKAVIIDYKTGAKETKHHKQLQTYAMAVSKMGYKIIELLLVYITDTEIEVIPVLE